MLSKTRQERRDEFAAMAMQGMIGPVLDQCLAGKESRANFDKEITHMAIDAFYVAEIMLRYSEEHEKLAIDATTEELKESS